MSWLSDHIAHALTDMRCDSGRHTIGVALSGGADSVALLVALHEAGFSQVALHCNFHLRGEESDGDARYCADLCRSIGIKLESVDFDTKALRLKGESIEMTCRRLRYEWFDQMAATLKLDFIAIAHHREDQVETVMLNLLRGCGVAGLRGMRPKRGIYVRPMLDCTRHQIEQYLNDRRIGWRTDSTNIANDYRRNALRNTIIPAIEQYFPDATAAILTTAANCADADADLNQLASQTLQIFSNGDQIAVNHFRPSQTDLLVRCIAQLFKVKISHATAADILSNTRYCRTASFTTEDGRILELYDSKLSEAQPLLPRTELLIDPFVGCTDPLIVAKLITREQFNNSERTPYHFYLDAGAIPDGARFALRHPRQADRMRPYGMRGTKLLSDILKESNLPPSVRANVWLLTCDDQILWVAGVRGSALYTVTPTTDYVLSLKYRGVKGK